MLPGRGTICAKLPSRAPNGKRRAAADPSKRSPLSGRLLGARLLSWRRLIRVLTVTFCVSNTAVHCNATPVVTGGNGLASLMHFTVTASLFAVFTESLSDAQPQKPSTLVVGREISDSQLNNFLLDFNDQGAASPTPVADT